MALGIDSYVEGVCADQHVFYLKDELFASSLFKMFDHKVICVCP